MTSTVPLILAAPLLGAIVLLLFGRRVGKSAGVFASAMVVIAFGAAAVSFLSLTSLEEGSRSVLVHLFDWLKVGPLEIAVDLRWDPLSAVMATMVTGVGFLIHVYSVGYMSHERAFARFPLVPSSPMGTFLHGHTAVFFVIATAAAEAAVGLAIIIAVFRSRATIHVDEMDSLRF